LWHKEKEEVMFFGIVMSPIGWIFAVMIALLLVFAPIFVIDAIARSFPEPLRTIVNVIGCFVVVPLLVTYLYKRKMMNKGRGSAIFWIYCGMFILLFANFLIQLFTKPLSLDTIAGPIVTGAVAAFMITVAYKTRLQLNQAYEEQYNMEREEDIRRKAEAILLAEKMKNEELLRSS
jgi:hypothetical protein